MTLGYSYQIMVTDGGLLVCLIGHVTIGFLGVHSTILYLIICIIPIRPI